MEAERTRLLSEGYGSWTKGRYREWSRLSNKHGRDGHDAIAAELGVPREDVTAYSATSSPTRPCRAASSSGRLSL